MQRINSYASARPCLWDTPIGYLKEEPLEFGRETRPRQIAVQLERVDKIRLKDAVKKAELVSAFFISHLFLPFAPLARAASPKILPELRVYIALVKLR